MHFPTGAWTLLLCLSMSADGRPVPLDDEWRRIDSIFASQLDALRKSLPLILTADDALTTTEEPTSTMTTATTWEETTTATTTWEETSTTMSSASPTVRFFDEEAALNGKIIGLDDALSLNPFLAKIPDGTRIRLEVKVSDGKQPELSVSRPSESEMETQVTVMKTKSTADVKVDKIPQRQAKRLPGSGMKPSTNGTRHWDHSKQQAVLQWGEPAKVWGEPAKVWGEPAKVWGEPARVWSEPAKVWGKPARTWYGETPVTTTEPAVTTTAEPDKRLQLVVDGKDYKQYRLEERTPEGYIIGEYGVLNGDGDIKGVRYAADQNINPKLIYDALIKFISL